MSEMKSGGALLSVRDLSVSFHTYAGEVKAVRGVSLDVYEGETLAIVGESGCGKSVTSKAIMGLIQTPPGEIKPESRITFGGENVLGYTRDQWRGYRGSKASIIFQDAIASLNPTMTIGKQIAETIVIHKKCSKREAMAGAIEMLETVGIPEAARRVKQYPHEFSGGMRQRAMIAIALACEPRLLIADEPTTALDVTIQAQIMDLIRDLQKRLNMSVIMITHDLGIVADMADRIVVMYAGKIVEEGSCRDIYYSPRHPYTWALIRSVPKLNEDKSQKLVSIAGTPPDLIAPPPGCPFATRCTYCMPVCKKHMPEATDFGGEHRALCWLHHEMAPREVPQIQTGGERIG